MHLDLQFAAFADSQQPPAVDATYLTSGTGTVYWSAPFNMLDCHYAHLEDNLLGNVRQKFPHCMSYMIITHKYTVFHLCYVKNDNLCKLSVYA